MNNNRFIPSIRAARMCPVCGNPSKVYRSEELPDGTIRRKRRCLSCEKRFQTIEQLQRLLDGE